MGAKYDTLSQYEKDVVDFVVDREMAKTGSLFGPQPEYDRTPQGIIREAKLREDFAHLGDKSEMIREYENARAEFSSRFRGSSIK